jgi:hypothetical protein
MNHGSSRFVSAAAYRALNQGKDVEDIHGEPLPWEEADGLSHVGKLKVSHGQLLPRGAGEVLAIIEAKRKRKPASADGGQGQLDPWADRTPFGEKMNSTIRDALAQKRYGERRTQDHRLESW